jgi:glycosyltransferase involved in cell wall biosynthesis
MNGKLSNRVLFLSWDSPWPPHSGGALRTLGILREISKVFEVELLVLTRHPFSPQQLEFLSKVAHIVTRIPLRDLSWADKAKALLLMIFKGYPYHSAILQISMGGYADLQRKILRFPGVVLANGHWGTLVKNRPMRNWILNQADADVEFWRVYQTQVSSSWVKLSAKINYRLAGNLYPQIYANVGRIISVCPEDRQYTLKFAPHAQVDVIENGVDCSYYVPDRMQRKSNPCLLFTGTSAERNMVALRQFVKDIFPLIHHEVPEVELLVAGDFSVKAQAEFADIAQMRFTGRVDDMRPFFNQGDVFIAPFIDAHGSKLKIAEAMAMAIPIVSTPMGVRGFQLIDGDSVLIGDSPPLFAKHIVMLLREPEQRLALGSAAREVALSTIDWRVLGKRLVAIVQATQDTIS